MCGRVGVPERSESAAMMLKPGLWWRHHNVGNVHTTMLAMPIPQCWRCPYHNVGDVSNTMLETPIPYHGTYSKERYIQGIEPA